MIDNASQCVIILVLPNVKHCETMKNSKTDKEKNKVGISVRVERPLYNLINELAKEDDRSMASVTERLVRSHPRIQKRLERAVAAC